MYYHPLINFHTLASFCKRQVPFGAGCIQIVIRIIGVIRNPPPSQSMAQQNGTKVLQSISCHCIMSLYYIASTKASGYSSNIFETRARFICLLHGVHVAANKMSYGSHFIFPGCFQDVRTSDPVQVKGLV